MYNLIRCLLSLLIVALPTIGAETSVEKANDLGTRIDRHRLSVISRAPEAHRELLEDDTKWGIHTGLYTEAFKAVPPGIVDDALLNKAAADAAELILKARTQMRAEKDLKAYVQQKLPELKKRVSEAPLDEATVKTALAKLNETAAMVERVMLASVAKLRIETRGVHLPNYVKARASHFNRNELDLAKYMEWSVREFVDECIHDAVTHQATAEGNHMRNFWYGNVTAEGWIKATVKPEDQLREFVSSLLIEKGKKSGELNQITEPTLIVDETFEHHTISAVRLAITYAIGL